MIIQYESAKTLYSVPNIHTMYAALCCCICKHHTLYVVLYLSSILLLLSPPLPPSLRAADALATTAAAADDVCLFVTTISGEWWLKDEGTFFEENNIKKRLPIILILHYGETNDQHHPQPKLRSFRDQAKTIRYCIMYCRHMQGQESGPKDYRWWKNKNKKCVEAETISIIQIYYKNEIHIIIRIRN